MFDYGQFVMQQKSMLIAPAGYGKTYTIAECIQCAIADRKQLILTHTHAGVASIKEKIRRKNIPTSKYHVETITSFAQKYVLAFYRGPIPEQSEPKSYYPFIIEKAAQLFKNKIISQVLETTYSGLFVDEYQDCTLNQNELIQQISSILPTHILGDPMQGIFEFNGEKLVNMQDDEVMGEFMKFSHELDQPQRWLNGNNEELGSDLKLIREKLIDNQKIDLGEFKSITSILVDEVDLFDPRKNYYRQINRLLQNESVLILHPDCITIYPRVNIIKTFSNRLNLIESIDSNDFYELAKTLDLLSEENVFPPIDKVCKSLFNKSGYGVWFNEVGCRKKMKESDRVKASEITEMLEMLKSHLSFSIVSRILKKIKGLPDVKHYRREMLSQICNALEEAEESRTTVYEAMKKERNSIRRIGRRVYGRCIGTTLLTKGLEFDTVVVLNAHKFDCPKHLYVALTRASKKLVVFTEKRILNPFE